MVHDLQGHFFVLLENQLRWFLYQQYKKVCFTLLLCMFFHVISHINECNIGVTQKSALNK